MQRNLSTGERSSSCSSEEDAHEDPAGWQPKMASAHSYHDTPSSSLLGVDPPDKRNTVFDSAAGEPVPVPSRRSLPSHQGTAPQAVERHSSRGPAPPPDMAEIE